MGLSKSVKIYVGIIIASGFILITTSMLKGGNLIHGEILAAAVFFFTLGTISESLPVRVKSDHLIAISSTISIASILLFDVQTATLIRFFAAMLAVQKGKTGYFHVFNRPLYRSLFNGSARGITVFFAGLTYHYVSSLVPNLSIVDFNIIGLLGLVVIYFMVDSTIFAVLFSLLSKTRLRDEIAGQLQTANQMTILTPFGVLLAGLYNWEGIFPIILFLGPLLFVRYVLEKDVQAKQTFQDTTALYQALSKITGKPETVKSLTRQIAETIVNDFHSYECAVWLLSDDRSYLFRNAYYGPETIETDGIIPMGVPGLITSSVKSGETRYAPDVRNDPQYQTGEETKLSLFTVPLRAYGEVIGTITMESPKPDDFDERTRHLISSFAQNAALALQNAKLVESLETNLANLKETQTRINFFLEHTAEGVYRIDFDPLIPTHLPFEEQFKLSVEHGMIGECNDAIAKMYGFTSRKEMLGKPYIEFYGKEGYDANLDANLDFYHQGYQIDGIETEEYNSKGEKVYFLNNVVGIIRDGYFVSTWGTQRDITPLKKAISELEIRNAELERFNYTLSHELKTPIVTIRGFLGYLENSISTGNIERARADFTRIGNAADKMYSMINELIELSRIGYTISSSTDFSFGEIVLAALNNVDTSTSENNIHIHVQPDLPTISVDRDRMTEVIQNLVENAVKYMGDQPNPQISIGIRAKENEQIFFISDNGMGIDPAYHDRVFNIFEKLDPQSKGTGIGLALVKRIIEAHGGRIWVESEGVGKGSTFCFTLPIKK